MEPVEYLRGIRRRWRVIVAAVLVSAVIALFTTAAAPGSQGDGTQFDASVLLLDARGTQFGSDTRGAQGVSLDTIAIFVTLDEVAKRAAKKLASTKDPSVLAESIEASADTETGILTITATARSGKRAERVADAFAAALTDYLKDQRRSELQLQIKALEGQIRRLPPDNNARGSSTERLSLSSQITTLKLELAAPLGLPVLDTPTAEAIEQPGLTAPTSTRSRLAIGAALGLLGGLALALVLERFDRRITTWRTAEELLPYPLLAEIPRVRMSRRLAVVDRPTSREADAFRLLASATIHAIEQARTVRAEGNGHGAIPETPMLAVTSAVRSEGKSMISANLAAAMGEMGKKVIVMTADLRSPTIHRYFDAPGAPGVVDAVNDWAGIASFRSVRHATKASSVTVIPRGSSSSRPAAVLATEEIQKLLRYARAECDVLILDTPALLISGDAVPLMQDADGVLLVARVGKTSIDAAARVSETLARLGAAVIGFTLNGAQSVGSGWRGSTYRVVERGSSIDLAPAATSDAPDALRTSLRG